jgi:hypothetical protein
MRMIVQAFYKFNIFLPSTQHFMSRGKQKSLLPKPIGGHINNTYNHIMMEFLILHEHL